MINLVKLCFSALIFMFGTYVFCFSGQSKPVKKLDDISVEERMYSKSSNLPKGGDAQFSATAPPNTVVTKSKSKNNEQLLLPDFDKVDGNIKGNHVFGRVAIIGAGPSGLAQLRAFQSAEEKGAQVPEVVCFEKQEDWGRQWHYLWRAGLDEYGEFLNVSIYQYLWSGGAKEGLEFADYSFDEHFGKRMPLAPEKELLWDYLAGRVKKYGTRDKIRFRTPVRRIEFNEGKKQFRVVAHDLNNGREYEEFFDHVIVASGRFSTLDTPYFKGFEDFDGQILRAHDYRAASELKDKNILIIGSSHSAGEIGSECWQSGCRSITASHRTASSDIDKNSCQKPLSLLTHVDNDTAYFSDGTNNKADVIILCTGYVHYFPFLEEKLKLRTDNRLAINNLYKGVVWADNPQLFFIGMQDQLFTFNMFDAQAWYVRDAILGRIDIPDRAVMIEDAEDRVKVENALIDVYGAINYQSEYIKELMGFTDYPDCYVDAAKQAFYEWKKHKKNKRKLLSARSKRALSIEP